MIGASTNSDDETNTHSDTDSDDDGDEVSRPNAHRQVRSATLIGVSVNSIFMFVYLYLNRLCRITDG